MIPRIFRMLSRFAVEILTLPVNQEYSLNIHHFKRCWGLPSYRSDKLRSRQIFGIHPVYQETFCTSTNFFFSYVSSRTKFYLEENYWRTNSHVYSGEKWKTKTTPRSEMPIWTVSQRFSHLQWRRLFQELWCRPTTIADFGSSFWQVPYSSNLCLLEDKVQNRGMYLFTISYGSDAMDQRRGVGWFSGWIEVFVIYSRYFNAEFWSTWWEDCFSVEQKSSIILTSKEESVWRNKRPRSRTVSFATNRLFTWSTIIYGSLGAMILARIMPTCSPLFFEMTIFRNSILSGTESYCQWRNPAWWHLGRIVQIKNTRVWETQDRIGIVRPGDSSKEVRTWLSQIESYGEEEYRTRNSKLEFWVQKWKFWEERRGQESGNKTTCTKNSWRLLAMGNQRAMCERKQL